MIIEEIYPLFKKSTGVTTDTRTMEGGELFFALRGENFDGNSFIRKALDNGCTGVVADDPATAKNPRVHVVPDALEVLQQLATHHRRQWGGKVLAITGSNGKTTTRELTAAVLSHKYKVLASRENLNNHIGVPLTLLKLTDEEVAVIEMGANHHGEIAMLAEIAEPDAGIITNIGKAHLEGFGSLEGVRQAKGELYDFLAANNRPVIANMSDPKLAEMVRERNLEYFSYGTGDGGYDVKGRFEGAGSNILGSFGWDDREFIVRSVLFGRYNFMNMLTAVAAGIWFGVKPADICLAIAGYQPDNNRSQLVNGKTNTLILDAYNANPTSMTAALDEFSQREDQRKMVILGDMLELGDHTMAEHEAVLRQLAVSSIDEVILVGEQFNTFASSPDYPFHFFISLDACLEYLEQNRPENYLILLKGSRKNALERATKLLQEC
mgnify:CR=1 FL=1